MHRLLPRPSLSTSTLALAIALLPAVAQAHTGGALDTDGCHSDHRTAKYHCHRGAAAGYTFPDRAAMLEAVKTKNFPEKTVDEEGFFSKLWPFGKDEEKEAAEGAAPAAGAEAASTAPAVPAKQREIEDRLKVLQGLYEMELITKEEYEQRRQAILSEL